jgi:hypothetical protein
MTYDELQKTLDGQMLESCEHDIAPILGFVADQETTASPEEMKSMIAECIARLCIPRGEGKTQMELVEEWETCRVELCLLIAIAKFIRERSEPIACATP